MLKQIGIAVLVLCSSLAVPASASTIPYPDIGTPAPANSFVAGATGDITAYFYATDAGYDSEIGLKVNGVSTGIYGLMNHASFYGQSLVLGSVMAGDILEFELRVLTTGTSWYSNPLNNSDLKNHTYATGFAGDSFIPMGTYVAFEDLPYLGDVDYNDHQFVFTNIRNTSVSESASLGLFAIGLIALMYTRRRFVP